MVAMFNIRPGLSHAVRAGIVSQVFTGPQRVQAKAGDPIKLVDAQTGNLISLATCTAVLGLELVWTGNHLSKIREEGIPLLSLLDCARRLGFADLTEMETHFRFEFGAVFTEGTVIEWQLPPPGAQVMAEAA